MPPALPSTSSGCLSPPASLQRECTSRGCWCSPLLWVSSPSRRSNQTIEHSVQPWNCTTRDVQIHVRVRMPLSSGEPQMSVFPSQGASFVHSFICSSHMYIRRCCPGPIVAMLVYCGCGARGMLQTSLLEAFIRQTNAAHSGWQPTERSAC